MGRIVILLAALTCVVSTNVLAQGDTIRYIQGLPVSDDDTVRQFPERDLQPANDLRPVGLPALPADVLEALDEEDQYRGWRDSIVYFQENTGLYLVPIKYKGGVKIFGVNKDGDPVTYDEVER